MPNRIKTHRNRAFRAQQGRCFYCGVAMWLVSPDELPVEPFQLSAAAAALLKCTAEHLLPRSEGGRNTAENITAACAYCNGTRHKRKRPPAPEAYRAEVGRRVDRGAWHQRWVFERKLLSPPAESHAATLVYPAKVKIAG
jgi:5-methylcytosine-specific restriction endonuclease McrA